MRGTALYLTLAIPFLLVPLAFEAFGERVEAGFAVSLLALIALCIVAAFRVRGIYESTTEPRSVFFGMLVAGIEVKAITGAWVGYIVAANLLLQGVFGFVIVLPVPPQPLRAISVGVATVFLLVPSFYYWVTIELERRATV